MSLRDRFFALSSRPNDKTEIEAFHREVDAVDAIPTIVDGLAVTWHPTKTHKALRFVDAARIDEAVRHQFARPSPEAPELAAVFADPRELSFRTFENIVSLDRLFEGAELALADRAKLATNVFSFKVVPSPATRARLDQLDQLNLYVPPLNASTRGGERFIFHSALLAEALTTAMQKAMPKALLGGFSHVNPVFRCNRFEPGDANFHRHRDTPYFDAARHHVSRYTVLIYLTGGSASPALNIEGTALDLIPELTCVVLDQKLEHEGAPYVDGRKVFLRTELVFTDPKLNYDPRIAAQFSKACYWTGESVFAPELAAYADRYYNQVAAAHWSGLDDRATREPFVHKQYRGVHFIANGYDFWFAKSDHVSLAECAAITLLDYFNCKIGDAPFRTQCATEVLDQPRDAAWIPSYLAGQTSAPALGVVDKAALFPAPEAPDHRCCPFHHFGGFDATRNSEIVDLYTRAQSFAKAHIQPAPIVMLGQEVAIDPSKFVISSDRIDIVGKQPLAPVNFAACWNSGGSPDNYLDVEATVGVVELLVPPIFYTETRGCYHLRFDFFRNSWMVQHQQANVPVPRIRDLVDDPDELDEDEARPWVDAVDPALIAGGTRGATIWWADKSPLLDELFSAREDLDDDDI